MNIPALAIKNYQVTIILFVLFLGIGLNSFLTMPQLEDPVLDLPNVVIVAIYPGASPEDMESQVVDIIEESVNEVDDIQELQTYIRDGVSVTEVEFIFGTSSEDKLEEVQRKVNAIKDELPDNLYDLDVFNVTTSTVAIFQLALVSEQAGYDEMKREAEALKKEIEDVNGVRKVEILATPEQEVRIALDPVKMTQMNVSLDDLERAIQSSNANIPGGAIKVSQKLFNIKTSGS